MIWYVNISLFLTCWLVLTFYLLAHEWSWIEGHPRILATLIVLWLVAGITFTLSGC